MDDPIYLLLLDPERVGDTLFVKDLAERLTGWGTEGPPRIVLHGSGPQTEQLLESEARFLDRGAGGAVAAETDEDRRLIERSVREINRRLVSLFTFQQVSAVSAHGTERGLLRAAMDGGEHGGVQVGAVEWITDLAVRSVTPVVSSLAETGGEGPAREIPIARAAAELTDALASPVRVVVFTEESGYGVRENGSWLESAPVTKVDAESAHPVYPLVEALLGEGVRPLLTSPRGLAAEGGVRGTVIEPAAS